MSSFLFCLFWFFFFLSLSLFLKHAGFLAMCLVAMCLVAQEAKPKPKAKSAVKPAGKKAIESG